MKKTGTLFICAGLLAVLAATGATVQVLKLRHDVAPAPKYPETQYGAFLAAQHAIYVNDFDNAAEFVKKLQDKDYAVVMNSRMIAEFLSGKLPDGAKLLQNEKSLPSGLIYDAYLVEQGAWDEIYKRHKKDESALSAPLRIWSSVATGHTADALKFIEKLPTNSSWKAFMRGQIHAQAGDAPKAAAEFAKVSSDFMNINDYLYMMSFYHAHDMADAANSLRQEFTSKPGGMFILDFDDVPAWDSFTGNSNALAFSLVQNVSHTQVMMYSDLAILLLRFAQIVGPMYAGDSDAINYYLGQYFYNNTGDYAHYFGKVSPQSPFYLFTVLRMADKTGDISELATAVHENPLFVPAVDKLAAYYVSKGNRRAALNLMSRALDNEKLSDAGRAHFIKSRAKIHFAFGDMTHAQSDIHDVSKIVPIDEEILALQARIWAVQNRDLDNAYEYAMTLVKKDPTNVYAWDTLGAVLAAREGVPVALELLERVGEVASNCSSLFEHLGDFYLQSGNKNSARDAYLRAIELSDDGLTIVPVLQKKLKDIK